MRASAPHILVAELPIDLARERVWKECSRRLGAMTTRQPLRFAALSTP